MRVSKRDSSRKEHSYFYFWQEGMLRGRRLRVAERVERARVAGSRSSGRGGGKLNEEGSGRGSSWDFEYLCVLVEEFSSL
jgi:hypothetical protein